jgi:pilus assembly protein Flp/PilA
VIHLARKLAADESGVTAAEYGLLAALLATVLVAAVPAIGSGLNHTARTVAGSLYGSAPELGGGHG